MITAATPAATGQSQGSEVLEVALGILQRHRDDDLSQKTFVMQQYLEISERYPEGNYREGLNKALSDLTSAVRHHLNKKLHAAGYTVRETVRSCTGSRKTQDLKGCDINDAGGTFR